MKKKYFNLILLSILTLNVLGQDTLYFDSKWKKTTADNAKFYRIELKTEIGFKRTDYFASNNQIQMCGEYISLNPEVRTGEFKWFHDNGKLKHIGAYTDNKEIGTHKWYFNNGGLEAIENYANGKLDGEYKEFNNNGKPSLETSFSNGLQNGLTKYYREDGSLHSKGQFKNGDKIGIWKYYNETGGIIGEEEYKTDYLIEEANMEIQFPSTKWQLASKTPGNMTGYIFKREEIIDKNGQKIIPAVMIYTEDASKYQDIMVFSVDKQMPLRSKGVQINETLIHENDNYPIGYKKSILYKCSYRQGEFDHILYMAHIVTKNKIGVQILMDMTKGISNDYENEFVEILKTIRFK
ncbi:toxin-antitoxin system YwqK family antitoxin [Puteibacter caeruleilacunae]|nr:toxin-antitoxin system YwqK family antitoxin [Puteibacter caeruleilacunae]